MSTSDRIFYGISSFLPLALVVGFLISIMGPLQSLMDSAAWNSGSPRKILPYLPDLFAAAFTLAILMTITTVALVVVFVLHVLRNAMLSRIERFVWIFLFLFAGIISFPAYFVLRIWNSKSNTLSRVRAEW